MFRFRVPLEADCDADFPCAIVAIFRSRIMSGEPSDLILSSV